jgi:hypothetical protein
MKPIGFSAVDEQIVCECFAVKAGDEVKSSTGIILEQKKAVPEIPLSGTVVSIGDGCPEHVRSLLGREVALPVGQAAGVMVNVPDPEVVFGRKTRTAGRLFVSIHYKAVRVVYDETKQQPEPESDVVEKPTQFVSKLSPM